MSNEVTIQELVSGLIFGLVFGLIVALVVYAVLWLVGLAFNWNNPLRQKQAAAIAGTLVGLLVLLSYIT
jgi:H+/Cl- antiporter ClcA